MRGDKLVFYLVTSRAAVGGYCLLCSTGLYGARQCSSTKHMRVFSSAFALVAKLQYFKMQAWVQNAPDAQVRVWTQLLRRAEHTRFGEQYGFSSIETIDQFRERVPIHSYETTKPYIDAVMRGQQNVLWDQTIEWMAKSSGTTSDRSKFIPVSESSLEMNHFRASRELLYAYYYHYPDSQLLNGKMVVVGGSHQVSALYGGVQYGDLSAVLLQNEPWLGRYLRVPELSIALMDEWEEKIERLARATMGENVTALAGVPTWSLVLLRKIIELKKASSIAEVWPNFELFVHGGVNFLPYRENFDRIIGKPIRYHNVYNASEGFIAFQDQPDADDLLLLADHAVFYEFLPLDQLDSPHPKTQLLSEVRCGQVYAPVLSTTGGLWRYLIGDTLEFTSLEPYRVKVVGRTKQFINAFGEEVMVANTDAAIAKACAQSQALLVDYTVAPLYFSENERDRSAAHEWLVEFEREPTDFSAFVQDLDCALQELNSDYEAKRHKGIALRLPVVHFLPRGTFEHWLKQKGKLGGQHKVPRLANHRGYMEEIKAFTTGL